MKNKNKSNDLVSVIKSGLSDFKNEKLKIRVKKKKKINNQIKY